MIGPRSQLISAASFNSSEAPRFEVSQWPTTIARYRQFFANNVAKLIFSDALSKRISGPPSQQSSPATFFDDERIINEFKSFVKSLRYNAQYYRQSSSNKWTPLFFASTHSVILLSWRISVKF